MNIAQFNQLKEEEKAEKLQQCCGSIAWVNKMLAAFPLEDVEDLFIKADKVWRDCSEQDWLEAFAQHPKIGDIASLKEKFSNTRHLAKGEQAEVQKTSDDILQALAAANIAYEHKFGYIFIVCATGKTAETMLTILKLRIQNHPEEEIKIAAVEQGRITRLRLEKLFAG